LCLTGFFINVKNGNESFKEYYSIVSS
jgi:hypothetical protein